MCNLHNVSNCYEMCNVRHIFDLLSDVHACPHHAYGTSGDIWNLIPFITSLRGNYLLGYNILTLSIYSQLLLWRTWISLSFDMSKALFYSQNIAKIKSLMGSWNNFNSGQWSLKLSEFWSGNKEHLNIQPRDIRIYKAGWYILKLQK